MNPRTSWLAPIPGLGLCCGIALAATGIEHLEMTWLGCSWLEALVLAIVLGTALRTLRAPGERYAPGIQCATKTLLELAVMLMGATVSLRAMVGAGLPLLAGIVLTVLGAITASFAIGRAFGLPKKMAILIACGNSICGNSAIAAVAPVIDAESDDVATSIAFTAVLGIAVVLLLPVLAFALRLDATASGVLAGLTVYAVPQVLAAAAPMGAQAVHMGTLVKLVRVLMLGPVVAMLCLLGTRRGEQADARPQMPRTKLFPTFILVFLLLAAAGSLQLLPETWTEPMQTASADLTVVAMAGLGLGVDLRQVVTAGLRVSLTVTLSLLVLTGFALAVIHATTTLR